MNTLAATNQKATHIWARHFDQHDDVALREGAAIARLLVIRPRRRASDDPATIALAPRPTVKLDQLGRRRIEVKA